jgi:hypothetical protein
MVMKSRLLGDPGTTDVIIHYYDMREEPPVAL